MNKIRKLAIEMTIGEWFSSWSGDEIGVYTDLASYPDRDQSFGNYIESVEALSDLTLCQGVEDDEYSRMHDFMAELEMDIRSNEYYLKRSLDISTDENNDGITTAINIKITAKDVQKVATFMYEQDVASSSETISQLESLSREQLSDILKTLLDDYDSDWGIDANTIRQAICQLLNLDPLDYVA